MGSITNNLTSHTGKRFYAAHFQGGSYPLYRYWTQQFFNAHISIPENVSILTCFNNIDNAILAQQLNKNKLQYIASTHTGSWSNPLKIKLILDGLEKVKTPYVIISDANDVLFTGAPIIIPEGLIGAIYNATKNNYPMEYIEHETDPLSQFRYFNAGLCIAHIECAKRLYTHADTISSTIHNPQDSEQLIIRNAIKNFDNISVDYECKYFQTFSCTHVEKRSDHEFSVV